MGGANVGPEFTATELAALYELCEREAQLTEGGANLLPSDFRAALEAAVVDSDRWRKWLTPEEEGRSFEELTAPRREWLVATGARYVWTRPQVLAARQRLYDNLRDGFPDELPDPHAFVVERIAQNIQMYVEAFNLGDSCPLLTG
jgi:D-tagatose-1,6-bisphosphate aldolase subunit GatZ/KbaZ